MPSFVGAAQRETNTMKGWGGIYISVEMGSSLLFLKNVSIPKMSKLVQKLFGRLFVSLLVSPAMS